MKIHILAATALIGIAGVAHAQTNANSSAQTGPVINAVDAMIEGNRITNITVEIDRPGYLVIHSDGAGAPPASLGHIALTQGRTGNISIEADGPLDPASNLTLMLHYETNDNQTYDFGPGSTDVDTPVMNGDAAVVVPVGPAM